MKDDRRLVLVVQGSADSTDMTFWLETPCPDHNGHVLKKHLLNLAGSPSENPNAWVLDVLALARQELCLCDAVELPGDALASLLEATDV